MSEPCDVARDRLGHRSRVVESLLVARSLEPRLRPTSLIGLSLPVTREVVESDTTLRRRLQSVPYRRLPGSASFYATRTENTGGSFDIAVNHVPPASREPNTSPDVAPK